MNIQIEENKQYYNRKRQVWEMKIRITYKHEKYFKLKEYFRFFDHGDVKGFINKIYTKNRDYERK